MPEQTKHTAQDHWEEYLKLIRTEIQEAEYHALEKVKKQLEAVNKSG